MAFVLYGSLHQLLKKQTTTLVLVLQTDEMLLEEGTLESYLG